MANTVDTLTLDASQMIAELAKLQAEFSAYNAAVGTTSNLALRLRETKKGLAGAFREVSSAGYELTGRLKDVNGQWQTSALRIRQTSEALKELRTQQELQKAQAGAKQAETFLKSVGSGTQTTAVQAQFQNSLRAAQKQLSEALGNEPFNLQIAQSIFGELKKGVVDVEVGIRGKIQQALIAVLNVQRRITEEQQKQAKAGTTAAQSAIAQAAAVAAATKVIQDQKLGSVAPVPTSLQGTLRTAQSQLAQSLGADPANLTVADQIAQRLKAGFVDVEVGIRGKIQQALISLLRIQERITAEQQKQAKAANPAPSSGATTGQLTAFRANVLGAFPVPSNASIGSVISYQAALNTLISVAARGKITFAELQTLFQNVSKNPLGDFSGGNKDLAQAQVVIQRVIQAHQAMTRSSKEAEDQGKKTGRSLYVSFSEFIKLLEIQIIHRAFGALLTGMQNSIGAAADLQIKISEIRTISQGTGLTFGDLQGRIRALSEEFGRPQLDVAEAVYQGFSNQVIRTAADMSIMNEVMRLARITVSDTASAMEAMSSVLKAYSMANFEAAGVTDMLFKAVEIGRFRLSDIGSTLGRVTVVAADAGVKVQEVLGLLANLTRRGISPAEAMTQISGIMQALIKPSEEMKRLLASWGVDSGIAAVQTFGFVEVLRRLSTEAQRSGGRLGELFNNVRALRGIIGATSGGGTDQLQTDISSITGGREQAAAAAQIVSESAGDRFRKELIKIQNFFVDDFGNSFLSQMELLTSKAGGLSNAFKDFGRAVLDISAVLIQLIQITQNVLSLGGTLNVDIGTLVKAFLLYKATVIGVSIAQGIATAAIAIYSAWKLTLTAVVAANTVATNLNWASIMAGAAAMYAATVAAIAKGVAFVILNIKTLLLAASMRLLAIAVASVPFIALGLAIAYVIGLLDPFKQKAQEVERAVAVLQNAGRTYSEQARRETEENQRRETDSLNRFRTQLDERVQLLSRALASIRRNATELVDEQRRAVEASTEKVKEAADGVKSKMADIISEIKRNINDARTNIENSLKQVSKFADRTATETFQRTLKIAGLQPVVQSGLRPISFEQQQVETIQRQGRTTAFQQQQELIQRRIATLTREANELSMRGDRDSMESARRKFQEVRHLSEQLFDLQTGEARSRATDVATDTARLTGGIVQATYQVNLRAFNDMMDQITQREGEAEARFRAAQKRREDEERARLERVREQQAAVNRTLQDMLRFRVSDQEGNLLERFRGPQGMQRMQADWEALNGRLETALRNSPLDPGSYAQLQLALNNQRLAMEGQIQRQLLEMRIAGTQQWLQREREAIETLSRTGADMRQQGLQIRGEAMAQLPQQLETMTTFVSRVRPQAVQAFAASIQALTQAQDAYNNSRGTVEEGEALRVLQQRIRETSELYRGYIRGVTQDQINASQAQSGVHPFGGRTALQESQRRLNIEQIGLNLQDAYDKISDGTGNIINAETRLARLNTQIQFLPAGLQAAALNINQLGDAANGQVIRVQNLVNVMTELANQVDRLRRPGQVQAVPGGGDIRDLAGMASGGLLGGMFSSRGPDDTIIRARRGEFVVNPESTQRFYTQLVAINRNKMPSFAQGGMVGNSTVGDITINVDGSKSPETTGRAIIRTIKRQIRRGNGSL
jgi:TP901 family phage tail tape measure protein